MAFLQHSLIIAFIMKLLCVPSRHTLQDNISGILSRARQIKTCGATRNPEIPRTGPNRAETGPGSGNIFKNRPIFGSGRVGKFYFGSVRVGAKDNGAFRGRGAKNLAPQDSKADKQGKQGQKNSRSQKDLSRS